MMRFKVFKETLRNIEAHPGIEAVGYSLGLTSLSDITDDEYEKMVAGDIKDPEDEHSHDHHPVVGGSRYPTIERDIKKLPKKFDWKKYQTEVKK